jgi:hypothetical protein
MGRCAHRRRSRCQVPRQEGVWMSKKRVGSGQPQRSEQGPTGRTSPQRWQGFMTHVGGTILIKEAADPGHTLTQGAGH